MLPTIHNLYVSPQRVEQTEEVHSLLEASGLRLDSIVSHGNPSPEGFWYDQDRPEWVLLLKGSAVLEFENGTLNLCAGDTLTIPAHQKHRVLEVSQDSIWLALHYDG